MESEKWQEPLVDVGIVIEDNKIKDSMIRIEIGTGVSAVLRENTFQNVDQSLLLKGSSGTILTVPQN